MILNSCEKVTYSIIFPSMLIFIIGVISGELLGIPILTYSSAILFFSGFALTIFFNGIYYPLKKKKHPYIENPEEIKNLIEYLETEKVKKIIKALYHEQRRRVYNIAWTIEKKLNIELHIKKGLYAGGIKSEAIYKTFDDILGTKTRRSWDLSLIQYYDKPTSHYIRDICIILSLLGGVVSIVLIAISNI